MTDPPADSDPAPHRSRVATAALASVPAATMFLLGTYHLSKRGMWADEYAAWYAATLPSGDLLRLLGHTDAVLAPYFLLLRLWIVAFGDSLVALRMPSVFAMAGAAGLVALIGRRLVGTPAAVIGALLFCVLPSTSRYAQETRPYAFAVAGALLATFLLLRAVDRPSLGRWIGYVAAVLFAAVSHIVTVLVLFGHGIAAWRPARPCGPAPFRRWLVAAAAVGAGVVPLALLGSQQTQAIGWITLNRWAVQTLPAALAGSQPVAAALAGAAFVGGCVLAATDRRALLVLLAWTVLPPVLCFVTFPVVHLFLARYLQFTAPAWCLLAGAGLYAASRTLSRRPEFRWTQVLLAAPMVALIAWVSIPGQMQVRPVALTWEPDFRAAASTLARNARAGDAIAYAGMRGGRLATAYELRGRHRPVDIFEDVPAAAIGRYWSLDCPDPVPCLGRTDRIWLVSTAPAATPFAGMPAARADLLRRHFTIAETHSHHHVQLLLLVRTS